MSNVQLIIEERAVTIGNFLVGRLLPFRQKRMVGPFIYIDHMGPVAMNERENVDIGPHPHIGLSTLTYLFEGSIMHRDSLGTAIEIKPGEVNWMTAGSGIVHSERTPEYLRNSPKHMHGLQIWVALPKHLEDMEPAFHHSNQEDLPAWEEIGVQYKLIAGEVMGKRSPVPVYSKLFMLEIHAQQTTTIDLKGKLFGEVGLYILNGSIVNDGNEYGPRQILVAHDAELCSFELTANSTIYLFGGEPFPEERFIDWNFVSTSKPKIEAAKQRWRDHQFTPVPGDDGYIPLPEPKKP